MYHVLYKHHGSSIAHVLSYIDIMLIHSLPMHHTEVEVTPHMNPGADHISESEPTDY
jgi:hypothetical protein